MEEGPYLSTKSQQAEQIHGSEPIQFNNQQWTQVNASVNWVNNTNSLWVSLGTHENRERLFVDDNSPLFMKLREQAIDQCEGKNIPEVLKTINSIIDNLCYENARYQGKSKEENNKAIESELHQFIKNQPKDNDGNVNVSLDTLAENGCLACRHRAILATSLMAYLSFQGV